MNEESTIIEKLNYLEGTKTSIKNAIISKGQEVAENDTFRSYAQKIAAIETGIDTSDATATAEDIKAGKTAYVDGEKIEGIHVDEDLTDVLNAQDQKIAELEEALENKTAGGEIKLNVYCQETEPENKNGIWLQTNKKLDNYIFDNDIIMEDGWGTDIGPLSGSFSDGCAAIVEDTIYIFGMWSNWSSGSTYNLSTGDKTTFSIPVYCRWAKCVAVGTDIYLWALNRAYKYDTITGVFTELSNSPLSVDGYTRGVIFYYNNYIYIAYANKYYKYDFTNDSYTLIATNGIYNYIGDVYNGYLYLANGSGTTITIYKVNIETGSYNTYGSFTSSVSSSTFQPAVCIVNGYFYMFSITPYASSSSTAKISYVYDIGANQATQIQNVPRALGEGKCVYRNNTILIVGGSKGTDDVSNLITQYKIAFKQFEDNSVIISQKVGYYKTVLIYTMPSNVIGLLNFFNNVWYYNDTDGLDDTIPTYYGDGTQWIKFKN